MYGGEDSVRSLLLTVQWSLEITGKLVRQARDVLNSQP